ncbi:MAG: autotransporter-associated beta strand repeat-containing protein, partial [Planctomycetota bacterium]|nr:autotransporter-associated beta strand repeat-containing protein [Planctomycetota bacterium]
MFSRNTMNLLGLGLAGAAGRRKAGSRACRWLAAVVLAALAGLMATNAQADIRTWDNGNANLLWGDAVNWNGDASIPGPADTATFTAATGVGIVDLGGVTRTIDALTVTGFPNNSTTNYTFTNGTLALNSINPLFDGRPINMVISAAVTDAGGAGGPGLVINKQPGDGGYLTISGKITISSTAYNAFRTYSTGQNYGSFTFGSTTPGDTNTVAGGVYLNDGMNSNSKVFQGTWTVGGNFQVNFGAAAPVQLKNTVSIGGNLINSGGGVVQNRPTSVQILSGSAVSVGGDLIMNASGTAWTIYSGTAYWDNITISQALKMTSAGKVNVYGGALKVNVTDPILDNVTGLADTSKVLLLGDTSAANSNDAQIEIDTAGKTLNNPITVQSGGTGQAILYSGATGTGTANKVTYAGNITLNKALTINANNTANAILDVTGKISGAQNLTINYNPVDSSTYAGTVSLSNTANDFGGSGKTVTLGGGLVRVSADSCFGNSANSIVFNNGGIQFDGSSFDITATGRTLTYASGKTVTIDTNGVSTTTFANPIGGLTKIGAGTLILSGGGSSDGIATVVNAGALTISGPAINTNVTVNTGGTLNLDYSTNNNSKIADGQTLTLAGGTLNMSGGTHTEVVASTTLAAGTTASSVTRASGSTAVLAMNTINPSAGAMVNFGAAGIATTDNSNVNGILGGWATVAGTDWAVNSTNAADGLITAYTGYTLTSVAGTTAANYTNNNIDVDNSAETLSGVITPNSLRFNAAAANTVTLAGGTSTISAGAILVNSAVGANLSTITGGTLTGPVSGNLAVFQNNASGGLTIASVIANNTATTLTKAGAGTLTLTGVNTYTGATTIYGGTLEIGGAGQLNSGAYSSTIAISTGTTLKYNSSADQTLSGIISGGGGLIKDNSGTLTLSAANTRTGDTTIKNGAIKIIGGDYRLSQTSTLTLGDTGTAGKLIIGDTAGWRRQRLAGLYTTGLGGSVVGGYPTPTGSITFSRLYLNIAGTDTFDGRLGGDLTNENYLSLFKGDVGTLILSGTNTHVGFSEVDVGTLLATKYASISSSLGVDRVWAASGATLAVRALEASTNGEWTSANLDLLLGGGGTTTSFDYGSTLGIEVTGTNTFTYANDIGGTSLIASNVAKGLVKLGAGTLTLTGANTYTGATSVSAGMLEIGGAGQLQSGNYAVAISVAGGATLKYNSSAAQTLGGVISGGGELNKNGAGALTLAASNTYTGATTVDSGTLVIAGNNNSCTGATYVNGGTLQIASTGTIENASDIVVGDGARFFYNNSTTPLSKMVTLNSGATLGGTGTIDVATTIGGGTKISPGADVGALTFTKDMTWQDGGKYVWEIKDAGAGPGIGWDFLNIIGKTLDMASLGTGEFTIEIHGLDTTTGNPGTPNNYTPGMPYQWLIASAENGILPLFNFDPAKFTIDETYANMNKGTLAFKMTVSDTDLFLELANAITTDRTWLGTQVGGTWSTDGNWNPSGVPGSVNPVFFDAQGTAMPNLTAAGSAKSIEFKTGDWTISQTDSQTLTVETGNITSAGDPGTTNTIAPEVLI